MKLGINTYTYMWSIGFEGSRPAKPFGLNDLLSKAVELGVNVIQLGPNLPLDQVPDIELEDFIQASRSLKIELELGTRGLDPDHISRQLELSQRLSSRLLRTVPEINGQAPTPSDLPSLLNRLVTSLERANIVLALENGNTPAQDLKSALDYVGSPLIGIVLDTVNSLAVSEGWKYVAEMLAPYTMCLHYKDFSIQRVRSMMGFRVEGTPAGQGHLEIGWLLEQLKASPHPFNVILELWPPEQATLAETVLLEQQWAVESIPYLRQYIAN
jgi:3-oxoisoapionate decarboxylase